MIAEPGWLTRSTTAPLARQGHEAGRAFFEPDSRAPLGPESAEHYSPKDTAAARLSLDNPSPLLLKPPPMKLSVEDHPVTSKRAIVRVDFNVP